MQVILDAPGYINKYLEDYQHLIDRINKIMQALNKIKGEGRDSQLSGVEQLDTKQPI